MKIYIKIAVALVLIVVSFFWAMNSVRALSYTGTDLNVNVGAGTVTVTNPSDLAVLAQIVSPGARVFTVTSSIAGVSGTSTTQNTGNNRTQLFEFSLPAGESQFTVTRGTGVSLVANTETRLQVNVQPLSQGDAQTTAIAAGVVILGSLYYISRTTNHSWIARLRSRISPVQPVVAAPVAATEGGQGPAMRSYGDNRESLS